MRISIIVTIIFSVFIISCGGSGNKKDVEEIMGEEKTDTKIDRDGLLTSSSYDRRQQDIIESLFQEELNKNQALSALIENMNAVEKLIADSTKNTSKFLDLNQRYFRAAERQVNAFKDSLLRKKVIDIYQKEQSKFNASVVLHNKYLEEIKNRNLILEDRKRLLKLFVTLPLIRKYQDEKLPDVEQLKNMKRDIERLIEEAEKTVEIE